MDFETALAGISMSRADARNPGKTNHTMSTVELQHLVPPLPLSLYFRAIQAPGFDTVRVEQPDYFNGLTDILRSTPMWHIRAYLWWQVLCKWSPCLSSFFSDADYDFFGATVFGQKEQRPRWKRMIAAANDALGEPIGQLYVARHFPPQAKQRIQDLADNMIAEFRRTIGKLPWMSEATRSRALDKVATFKIRVGYPDKWQDFSSLRIERGSFLANCLRAAEFHKRVNLAKIGQPVDKDEWHMLPHTVNAQYNPRANTQTFPAGFLQPPFFDPLADDAFNHGGICMVIGHEGWHGYDANGRQIDDEGNLNDWWLDGDGDFYAEMTALIVEQYNGFVTESGKHLKGELVVGEAGADLGGLIIAYRALQHLLDRTGKHIFDEQMFIDEERFFIAFAQVHAELQTPEFEDWQVTSDEHPPGRFRVNGTLAHMQEFCRAFGLSDDCPMMLPMDKRCRMWG
jgi:putative endopeptidase